MCRCKGCRGAAVGGADSSASAPLALSETQALLEAPAVSQEPAVDRKSGTSGTTGTTGAAFLRDGVVTFLALLLAFAAIDDITTDNATSFQVEYAALIVCAAWLGFVAWRLFLSGHRVLGSVSTLALATAMWAQRGIRPGVVPGLRPEYVVINLAYFWFWVLTFTLFWLGRRPHRVGRPLGT
jgi:hypothetical protein